MARIPAPYGFAQTGVRWTPKAGKTVLDDLAAKPDYMPHFRYMIRRNGHVVALYLNAASAIKQMDDRKVALPLDTWQAIDRQTGGVQ